MTYLKVIFLVFFLSSCSTYLVADSIKDKHKNPNANENANADASIAAAIAYDAALIADVVGVVKDKIDKKNQTIPPRHSGSIDAQCNADTPHKICSVNKGCWCQEPTI